MPVKLCAPMCTNWCTRVVAPRMAQSPTCTWPASSQALAKDVWAADLAVVREVHVRHDPVVVAHARHARVARRAAVDGDVFAYRVAVADLHGRVFAALFLVLR